MKITSHRPDGTQGRHHILDVYLNDHLAGATAGTELARRMAGEHSDSVFGSELETLAVEISQDRQQLLRLLADLGIAVNRHMMYGAWLGEKIGRLKPNGRLLRRSGLAILVELETMRLGAQGKVLLWKSLLAVSAEEPRLEPDRLEQLLERAEEQVRTLDTLHAGAATALLSPLPHRKTPGSAR